MFLYVGLLIIATLLIAECGLRIAGVTIKLAQQIQNSNKSAGLKVLCIGESTTYLGGKDSYPNQLQQILEERYPGQFTVINQGLPGIGSTYIINNLPFWIAQYKPDIIVAMMGINDELMLRPSTKPTFFDNAKAFSTQLRVYKVYQWLRNSFWARKKKIYDDPNFIAPPGYGVEALQEIRKYPAEFRMASIGVAFLRTKKFALAEVIFKKLIAKNISPDINRLLEEHLEPCLLQQKKYRELAILIHHRMKNDFGDLKVKEWISELIDKQDIAALQNIVPVFEYHLAQQHDEAEHCDLLAASYDILGKRERAQHYRSVARQIRSNLYSPVTEQNSIALHRLAKDHGIKLVLVQYLLRDIKIVKNIFRTQAEAASIVFVDNKDNFEKALAEQDYYEIFSDRFAGDFGHSTARGNNILAENIANALEKYANDSKYSQLRNSSN